MAKDSDNNLLVYIVTGVYGFLIVFLFAFVITIFQKVKKLEREYDDSKSDISNSPKSRGAELSIPKPAPSNRNHDHNETNLPDRYSPDINTPERSLPERNLPERNQPERNYPERNPPERSYPERGYGLANLRGGKDFNDIDFNNRMGSDKPFKPPTAHGGPYKNPLFDQLNSELDSRYDFNDSRDKPKHKPHAPGFRPTNPGFNQPSNLYPKREYSNSNFRY